MTSSMTYGIVTVTLDGVRSFLQLLNAQNVPKNTRFSLNKSCGKFKQSVQDGGIVIEFKRFVYIFNLLLESVCFNLC